MSETPEDRLRRLGLVLPPPAKPAGAYAPACRVGSLLFLSGVGPMRPDGSYVTGRIGDDLTVAQGFEAARLCGLVLLANMRQALGSLDRVARIVKAFGMVRCAPEFGRQPEVIDGCTTLFVEMFGEAGRPARSAVGMAALPFGIAVEIEAVAEVAD